MATISYAQVIKGQPTSTKTTPPRASQPAEVAAFSELGPNGNWADDVDASEPVVAESKIPKTPESHETQTKVHPLQDIAAERPKMESRSQHQGPFDLVSSPDMGASASTIPDDLSSNPAGPSSDSTWDAKSQTSEPAWIADRKERQGHEATTQSSKKASKEPSPAPPPRKMQEAPPPAVNPWAKRAEDAKVKSVLAAQHSPQSVTASSPSSDGKDGAAPKMGQQKKTDPSPPNNAADVKKPNGLGVPRVHDSRANSKQAGSKSFSDDVRVGPENAVPSKHAAREIKNIAPLPPSADESLWPTPDTVQEKKHKEVTTEKEDNDVQNAEASQGVKAPKKTWQPMAVTPNIVWETPEMNRPRGFGEKGGRSNNGTRARGGFRGGANGPKSGDRNNAKHSPEKESSPRGRQSTGDREAMPPPSKPLRTASLGQSRERNTRPIHESKAPFAAGSNVAPPHAVGHGNGIQGNLQSSKPQSVSAAISANGRDPAGVAPFVPQNSSTLAQAKELSGNNGHSARETQSTKFTSPAEGKKEARPYEAHHKEWNGPHRGGKRGGRGRGGSREYANGHQAISPYAGTFPDPNPGPFAIPPSPSGFPPSRGGGQFGHQSQGRGGSNWTRGGQRAQSIPLDNSYGSRFNAYPPMPAMAGFMPPPSFDPVAFGGMPTMPYSPAYDLEHMLNVNTSQVEYYFSTLNMEHDIFLRKNMDGQGFVLLDLIATFNRIKLTVTDRDQLRVACLRSDTLELVVGDDNRERLRRREGWEEFVLPIEQREPSARNEGPLQKQRPEVPPAWAGSLTAYRGPGVAPPQARRSYDSGFSLSNSQMSTFVPFSPLVESTYTPGPNGYESRGRTPKSPIRDVDGAAMHVPSPGAAPEKDQEPDAFADEHVSVLTVVVKPNHTRAPYHTAASRTFSNGSIDPRAVFGADGGKPADDLTRSTSIGEASANGDETKRNASRPGLGRSAESDMGGSEISLFWVKDKEMPADSLPQGSAHEPYLQLRLKALNQRSHAATGQCPYDLDVLYQFWSHFLIRNFNGKMYGEFKYFAHDDAQQRGSMAGLHNLVQFYAKALLSSNPVRDRILRDYVELVKTEPSALDGQAFKQLRSAWRNGALNLKNRKKLTDMVDDTLRERLES